MSHRWRALAPRSVPVAGLGALLASGVAWGAEGEGEEDGGPIPYAPRWLGSMGVYEEKASVGVRAAGEGARVRREAGGEGRPEGGAEGRRVLLSFGARLWVLGPRPLPEGFASHPAAVVDPRAPFTTPDLLRPPMRGICGVAGPPVACDVLQHASAPVHPHSLHSPPPRWPRNGPPVVKGALTARVEAGPVELGLAVDNLLGSEWRDGEFVDASWWDKGRPESALPVTHVTAGAPFAFRGSLRLRL
ncbi:hypothetical protein L6R50_12275 [Myxococcota bacterium]|nr:hypothetical protein [Myxococcota bacterium]